MDLEGSWGKAGIFAEFGKIVCISVGLFHGSAHHREFRLKSFFGEDEKALLTDFASLLNQYFNNPDQLLCAHNGKEFDFPYIARRMLVHGIALPLLLDIAGKKPWEVAHLDTMELWKFGDRKNFTSIALLTKLFDIPSPKDDMDGSMVGQVYWEENGLDRIEHYCRQDVLALAQLMLRYRGEPLLAEDQVIHSP